MTAETAPSASGGPCDPFELLGLPRRPWIDPEELQNRLDSAARISHPDAAGETAAFANLNAAAEQLRHPHLRLAALLRASASSQGDRLIDVPPDLSALVFQVAEQCRLATDHLAKKPASNLASALRNRQLQESARRLSELRGAVEDLIAAATDSLKTLDDNWENMPASAREEPVQKLRARFAFLHRALANLTESLTRIEIETHASLPGSRTSAC